MSHATEAPDPGWPDLRPPDREPRRPDADHGAPDAESEAPDDDLFGDWQPRRRVPRLTVVLAAAVLIVAGFAGGALIGKRSAQASASTGTGAAARFAAAAGAAGREGFPASGGGNGGFGGTGAGGAGGAGGAAGARSGAGTGAGAAGTPVVVGTIESVTGDRVTVKNFAGATVVVKVPAGTPVTTNGLQGLVKGLTVSVQGTRSPDGTVTASSVVSRS